MYGLYLECEIKFRVHFPGIIENLKVNANGIYLSFTNVRHSRGGSKPKRRINTVKYFK